MKTMQKMFILLVLLGLQACASNPATHETDFVLMSEDDELALGAKYAAEIESRMPILDAKDPLSRYVDEVGQRLANVSDRPELVYHFTVIKDPTINAFALPGGYIYIYRGLLTQLNSEAELAAVLAHEIGHVTARHMVEQYTRQQSYNLGLNVLAMFVPIPLVAGQLSNIIAQAAFAGFGREDESQSDVLSIRYLQKAHYDLDATRRMLKTLQLLDQVQQAETKDMGETPSVYHGAFATHPETQKRIDDALAEAEKKAQGETGKVGRMTFLKAIDGYPYLNDEDQGAVLGSLFIHPGIGIHLQFPKDWIIRNGSLALTAKLRDPDHKVYSQLNMVPRKKKHELQATLEKLFPYHRGEISFGEQDGFHYAQVRVKQSAKHVSKATILATLFESEAHSRQYFLLQTWAQRDEFENYIAQAKRIMQSFGEYDPKRDGHIPRIQLYSWQQQDSWKTLAAKLQPVLGSQSIARLAAFNGMRVDETPSVGQWIKLISPINAEVDDQQSPE